MVGLFWLVVKVVSLFWVAVGRGGWWWMVVGGGTVHNSPSFNIFLTY